MMYNNGVHIEQSGRTVLSMYGALLTPPITYEKFYTNESHA